MRTTYLDLVYGNLFRIRETGRLPVLEDGHAFVVCCADDSSVKRTPSKLPRFLQTTMLLTQVRGTPLQRSYRPARTARLV